MPLFRRKKHHNMGLTALAKATANMAKNMIVLDKTEAALEREVEKEEKRTPPKTTIGKIRRKGEHVIHGRYVLLMVILLNAIDCLLVLAELLLDIEYITDLLEKEKYRSEQFIGAMKCRYPARLGELGSEAKHMNELLVEILNAKLTWDNRDTGSDAPQAPAYNGTRRRSFDGLVNTSAGNSKDCGNGTFLRGYNDRRDLEDKIAHSFHKASITILGILFLENMFKIFCLGKALLEHKLECFDSVIVTASFILDIVFVKGSQQFALHELVFFMAFIVPWRIIRVVNSLVVAILYHEHLRLVHVYKHKKRISQELKEAKTDINALKACIDALKKLCKDDGISDTLVDARLNMYWKVKAQTSITGALSSLVLGVVAMEKPFILIANGDIPNPSSVITSDTTIQAKKIESVLDSNINMSQDFTEQENRESTGKLAETKTSFIATINNYEAGFYSISYMSKDSTEHENRESIEKLPENNTSFIVTINNDEAVLDSNSSMSKKYYTEHENRESIQKLAENNTPFIITINNDEAGLDSISSMSKDSTEHENRESIQKLAENNSSFIATINNDEADLDSISNMSKDSTEHEKRESIEKLAENNSSFIATINNDEAGLDSISNMQKDSTEHENRESIEKLAENNSSFIATINSVKQKR